MMGLSARRRNEKEANKPVQRRAFCDSEKSANLHRLKEDEIGESLLKMHLMKEAAQTYNVPISILRRRIEDELVADEGQGVGTE